MKHSRLQPFRLFAARQKTGLRNPVRSKPRSAGKFFADYVILTVGRRPRPGPRGRIVSEIPRPRQPPMNRQRLLKRFLQYVQIDTKANDQTEAYPSSPGQKEFGKLLVQQLLEIGLTDARQDNNGIVIATVPGNLDRPAPATKDDPLAGHHPGRNRQSVAGPPAGRRRSAPGYSPG